jgi:hypothetical protein
MGEKTGDMANLLRIAEEAEKARRHKAAGKGE